MKMVGTRAMQQKRRRHLRFGIVSATPVIQAYIERANARPATLRVQAKDAQLAAAQS